MKVTCDRGALLEAINLASSVVATRSPRPQLTCIKLTAERKGKAGTLTLAATDGEISIRLSVAQVDVQTPGEALLPADKLRQIVSAEDNEPTLSLEMDENLVCHIRGNDAHFKLIGQPAGEFPPITEFRTAVAGSGGRPPAKAVFTHDARSLGELISRTLFATARETSRYAINGVLMVREGKRLQMVATDGRRLALSRATLSGGEKDASSVRCIVPSKGLSTLQKLLGGSDETVQIAVTDNQVYFNVGAPDAKDHADGRAVLSSNLVEGAFPPYEDVIPKDQDKTIVVDRDALTSAVHRAALLTNEESRGVRMAFDSKGRQAHLSAHASEVGEANVELSLAEYKGDDIEIGFNPAFITDALKVIADPQVVIELKASNKPGLIKSGQDFTYVVMPVNLS